MAQDEIHMSPGSPANISPPSQQMIIQQPGGRFGRFGSWLLGALAIGAFIAMQVYSEYQSYYTPKNQPKEKYHSLEKQAVKKIAVINISGAIMEEQDGYIKKQIDLVREDPDVVAVVARINSPGGTVTGSDFVYHHLRRMVDERGLPLVVSMGSVCASGGYYVAMAVGNQPDAVFAEPTTWTGSIGVIIPHFDVSGALGALLIADDSIASGPLKEMGSPTRKMSDEERKLLQELVDDSFKGFKQIVMNGRPKFKDEPAKLDAVATGQIFTANQALERGLVDKIGFVEDAILRAAELAKIDPKEVRCVKYEEASSLLGELASASAPVPARGTTQLSMLVDVMTPRAYYLWSWLPSVMANSR